jgi:hypothetical protein
MRIDVYRNGWMDRHKNEIWEDFHILHFDEFNARERHWLDYKFDISKYYLKE